MDKVKINIQVGDYQHPMTVERDEEPYVREAARLINDRLVAYRTKYRVSNLSQEYMLTFAAMDIATKYVKMLRTTDVASVEEALRSLTSELEDFNQNR